MSILNSLIDGCFGGAGLYLILNGFNIKLVSIIEKYLSFSLNLGTKNSIMLFSILVGLLFAFMSYLISR